jgi:hypothetical protein
MSTEIPLPSATAIAAQAEDAKRSRRGRTSIGIGLILLGAMAGLGMAWLYSNYGYLIDTLSESERSEAVMFDALSVLFILALLGGGIWNIAARRTSFLAPLIAALVLSGVGLAFAVSNVVDALVTTGTMPNLVAPFLYVGIVAQTIRVLRVKPTRVAPGAVL